MQVRLAAALLAVVVGTGCVISEQDGRLTQEGNPRYHVDKGPLPVEFHFQSPFNNAVVFGRSLALLLAALFFFKPAPGGSRSTLGVVLGIVLLGAAGWLLARDLPTLLKYHIGLVDEGLQLTIPPEPARTIDWGDIEEMDISGREWYSSGQAPFPGAATLEMAEWEWVDMKLKGGERVTIDVSRLSIEQRKTVWSSIATRAHLVKTD